MHSTINDQKIYHRQFIYSCPENILFDQDINLSQLRLYMMIRSFMDTTGVCYASNNWIAKKLGINRRNTIAYINALIKKNFIERITKAGKRYLRIKLNPIDESLLVSQSDTGGVSQRDTGGVSESDTQLDQSNIITKEDIANNYARAREDENQSDFEEAIYSEARFKSSFPIPEEDPPVYVNQGGLVTQEGRHDLSICNGFEEFWKLYPRKASKDRARMQWIHDGCEAKAGEIIAKLKDQIARDSSFVDGFVPNPWKYIVEKKYKDEVFEKKKKGFYDYNDTSWADKRDIFDEI